VIAQLLRFAGVGGLATLAHVLTALAVQAALPLTAQAANLAGFVAGFATSYAGHARVTFNAPLRSVPQFLRFLLLSLLGLAASSLAVWVVTTVIGASFALAMAAVVVIVPAVSYVAMRLWVFNEQSEIPVALAWDTALCGGMALILLAVFQDRLVNHDIAWYLFATRDWLAGDRLYVDLVEVNPPLNFYLTVPALGLADLFAISDQHGHYVAVSLYLFGSLLWCSTILRRDFGFSAGRRALLLCGLELAVTLPALDGIGQREQIMVLLFLPWAFHQAARQETVPSAIVAAIGMCLKPHFICLPLAVTVLNCVQDRSLRPVLSTSNLVFLGVGLAYVGFVWAVHPAYLFDIVGLSIDVYGAYSKPMAEVLWRVGYPMGLVALIVLTGLRSQRLTRPVGVLLVLALGGLGSYVLQGKGFSYHMLPFVSFSMIACLLILLEAGKPRPDLIAAALGLVGLTASSLQQGFYRNDAVVEIAQTVRDLGPFDRMITMTSNLYTGPAVAMALGADWASSYPANWLVPGAVNRLAQTDCASQAEVCAKLRAILDRNRTANLRDIERWRPDLLVVDLKSDDFDEPVFDWLAFMAADPAWDGVFARYRQVATSGRFLYFLRQPE